MAVSMRSKAFANTASRRAPRANTVVVRAEKGHGQQVQLAAATIFSAAALLSAPAADAGVTLAQPQLKKIFYDDSTPVERPAPTVSSLAAKPAAAPAVKAAAPAAPKPKVEESTSDGGVDPRSVALPGALVFIGGLLGLSKLDGEFDEWIDGVLAKNSSVLGAGYEPALKPDNGAPLVLAGAGSKKIAAKKGKK